MSERYTVVVASLLSTMTLTAAAWAQSAPLSAQTQPAATPPAIVPGPQGSPLRLQDVLATAAERNPRLRAMRASAAAAEARVDEAWALPDPTLQLGVMNFGIPDFNTDMAMSMAPSVQLMQMVPFPGKLSLRGEVAALTGAMAGASADEAWWEVRGQVSNLFYRLYALDRRIEVTRETLGLLEDFQLVAKAMYSAGTGRQTDVLRADVEVARMDGEIRKMEATRLAAAARLNGLLDLSARSPVGTPELGPLPLATPSHDTLSAWADESRPLLQRAFLGVDQADTRVDLARREIWPNFSLGFQYGQRDRGAGTERMASALIGFTLPIHAGSRQLALRDEAEAMRRMAEANLGALQSEVDARLGELLAELERARSLIGLYRDEVLPEARATVESALSSYRVGTVDFMTLVDAQMTVDLYQGELYQLLADYGTAITALESTIGRTLPLTKPILAEKP